MNLFLSFEVEVYTIALKEHTLFWDFFEKFIVVIIQKNMVIDFYLDPSYDSWRMDKKNLTASTLRIITR
jgi:hypothetical protein